MATIRRGSTLSGHLLWGPSVAIEPVDLNVHPVPPPTLPAKAKITSFETPIRPDQTSRAVRQITQGTPAKLRWQWTANGTIWHTAAVNAPSDADHSYNRPNPPWDNQFPGVGRYPIRLQCLDANGNVTDSSNPTSRVIEVRAAAPTPIPPEPPTPNPVPPASFPGRLSIYGTTFRRPAGDIWKWHGVTAFTALQDYLAGNLGKLERFAEWTQQLGGQVWRVFGMWSVTNFSPLTSPNYYDALRGLSVWLEQRGLYLHFVAFTDQVSGSVIRMSEADQDNHWQRVGAALVDRPNIFLEAVNEDWKNGQIAHRFHRVGTMKLTRSAFQDGQSYTQPGALWDWTTEHTPRDGQWMRKGKNLLETSRQGLGPIAPPSGVPPVSGEPIGIFEENQPGRRTSDPKAIADYFAVVELYGAGGNLHGDMSSLMSCNLPGPKAQLCANAVRDVWTCGIPLDAASTGQYTRGPLATCPLVHHDRYDDDGHEVDPSGALRTFGMIQGNQATCVVVQAGPEWKLRTIAPWIVRRQGGPHGQVIWLAR